MADAKELLSEAYNQGWKDSRQIVQDYTSACNAGAGWRMIAVFCAVLLFVPFGVLWMLWMGADLRPNALPIAGVMLATGLGGAWFATVKERKASKAAFAAYNAKWGGDAQA